MNLSTERRTGAALAGLLALCIFLASPLVLANHHHPAELAQHCCLCLFSSTALADTAQACSTTLNLEASEHFCIESDAIVALDVAVDRPARAPPRA